MTAHLHALCFDSSDPGGLARFWLRFVPSEVGYFWSKALEWPLVRDQDQETAIQSPQGGTKVTWGGPPVAPKLGKNRLHLDLA